jgi:hypothetical protein
VGVSVDFTQQTCGIHHEHDGKGHCKDGLLVKVKRSTLYLQGYKKPRVSIPFLFIEKGWKAQIFSFT